MGHILIGLPEIRHFHLLSRVARKLMTREHRVSVLTSDPIAFEFFCHQGLSCRDLRPGTAAPHQSIPLAKFAEIDCRLAGISSPTKRQVRRQSERLGGLVNGLLRTFDADSPSIVLLHEARGGAHRMLHYVAQQCGTQVIYTGPGLLPGTMQVDMEGIDGDASYADGSARDYRRASADEEFLAAATAAWLGRAYPPALARTGIAVPPLLNRVLAAFRSCWRGQWTSGLRGTRAWEGARETWPHREQQRQLPSAPYGVVLLQDPADPRLRLDAPAAPTHETLISASADAIRQLDSDAQTLVITPGTSTSPSSRNRWPEDVQFLPASAGALAVATASVVISVNHPLGIAGILTGTPVLHMGRTPYGVERVSQHTAVQRIAADLARAVEEEHPALRRRFLTKMLRDFHTWCPPSEPDSNGVAGLIQRMEQWMGCPPRKHRPLRYRPGPVWPLAVPTQGKS